MNLHRLLCKIGLHDFPTKDTCSMCRCCPVMRRVRAGGAWIYERGDKDAMGFTVTPEEYLARRSALNDRHIVEGDLSHAERCPKCGAPMCEEWSRELDENLEPIAYQVCSADRRDCRIVELEKQVAELVEAAKNPPIPAWTRASKLADRVSSFLVHGPNPHGAADAEEAMECLTQLVREMDSYPISNLIEERSRFRSERDAALAQVVVLNRVLRIVKEELDKDHECPGCKLPLIAHHGVLEQALSTTSATAQDFVHRIEREAVEKFFAIITDPGNEIVWVRPSGRSIHADPRFIRAAILGSEK